MLKKAVLATLGILSASSSFAGDTTLSRGDGYDFLSRTPSGLGPGISLDYLAQRQHRADTAQATAAGIGLMFGLPVPAVLRVDIGAKAMYLDAAGYASAAMVGGRVTVDMPFNSEVFAHSYHAPARAASGSIKSVSDNMIGLRISPLKLVGIEAGYRQFEVKREDSMRNRKLADGAYAGISVAF